MRSCGLVEDARPWLERLEAELGSDAGYDDPRPTLAYLAGQEVAFDPGTLSAARRRALLLLATGGDPRRELELDGRAVRSLASELDEAGRRAELAGALTALRATAAGLPHVTAAVDDLLADADLAWRRLAGALLVEELAGDVPD
jgi:hypothetical protein